MFGNFDEFLKALQGLGGGGGVTPPATPETPAMPAAPVAPAAPSPQQVDPMKTGSIPPNSAQYAGMSNPNGPSAPGLTGQFPDAPGMNGMLGPVGRALGLNDGKAGPTAFGGLLNFKDEDSKQAALRGMLGASAGLMSAGGPSDKPHSIGQDLAQGVGSGLAGYDGFKDANTDRAAKAAQTQRYGIANAQDAYKLQQAQKADAIRARLWGGQSFDGGSNTGATNVPTSASAPAPSAPANGGSDLARQINRQRQTYQAQYDALMSINDGENARPIFTQMNNLDNEAAKQGLVWNGQTYTAAPGFNEGAGALKQAEATGTSLGNRNAWTDDQKELNQVNTERASKGVAALGMEEYSTSQKRAGATTVNVGEGNKVGAIPEGYMLSTQPDPNKPGGTLTSMVPIPGGPAELKANQAAAAKDSKDAHKEVSSDAVDNAFNNVLRVRQNSTLPTNGMIGGMLSHIGGFGSNDMRAAMETLKANASLSTLQKMRDESPTGAGMGNPTASEQEMIQASLASLDQSQSNEEFIRNLNNFRNLWMDLVHGQGNGPARHPVTYGMNPLTADEQAAAESGQVQPGTQAAPQQAPAEQAAQPLPKISTVDDYYALKPGTVYIDPNGKTKTKR